MGDLIYRKGCPSAQYKTDDELMSYIPFKPVFYSKGYDPLMVKNLYTTIT